MASSNLDALSAIATALDEYVDSGLIQTGEPSESIEPSVLGSQTVAVPVEGVTGDEQAIVVQKEEGGETYCDLDVSTQQYGKQQLQPRTVKPAMRERWQKELDENQVIACSVPSCEMRYSTLFSIERHYKWCTGDKGQGVEKCTYCDCQFLATSDGIDEHVAKEHPSYITDYHARRVAKKILAEGRQREKRAAEEKEARALEAMRARELDPNRGNYPKRQTCYNRKTGEDRKVRLDGDGRGKGRGRGKVYPKKTKEQMDESEDVDDPGAVVRRATRTTTKNSEPVLEVSRNWTVQRRMYGKIVGRHSQSDDDESESAVALIRDEGQGDASETEEVVHYIAHPDGALEEVIPIETEGCVTIGEEVQDSDDENYQLVIVTGGTEGQKVVQLIQEQPQKQQKLEQKKGKEQLAEQPPRKLTLVEEIAKEFEALDSPAPPDAPMEEENVDENVPQATVLVDGNNVAYLTEQTVENADGEQEIQHILVPAENLSQFMSENLLMVGEGGEMQMVQLTSDQDAVELSVDDLVDSKMETVLNANEELGQEVEQVATPITTVISQEIGDIEHIPKTEPKKTEQSPSRATPRKPPKVLLLEREKEVPVDAFQLKSPENLTAKINMGSDYLSQAGSLYTDGSRVQKMNLNYEQANILNKFPDMPTTSSSPEINGVGLRGSSQKLFDRLAGSPENRRPAILSRKREYLESESAKRAKYEIDDDYEPSAKRRPQTRQGRRPDLATTPVHKAIFGASKGSPLNKSAERRMPELTVSPGKGGALPSILTPGGKQQIKVYTSTKDGKLVPLKDMSLLHRNPQIKIMSSNKEGKLTTMEGGDPKELLKTVQQLVGESPQAESTDSISMQPLHLPKRRGRPPKGPDQKDDEPLYIRKPSFLQGTDSIVTRANTRGRGRGQIVRRKRGRPAAYCPPDLSRSRVPVGATDLQSASDSNDGTETPPVKRVSINGPELLELQAEDSYEDSQESSFQMKEDSDFGHSSFKVTDLNGKMKYVPDVIEDIIGEEEEPLVDYAELVSAPAARRGRGRGGRRGGRGRGRGRWNNRALAKPEFDDSSQADSLSAKDEEAEDFKCSACDQVFDSHKAALAHVVFKHNGLGKINDPTPIDEKEKPILWKIALKHRKTLVCQNVNCNRIFRSIGGFVAHYKTCGVEVNKEDLVSNQGVTNSDCQTNINNNTDDAQGNEHKTVPANLEPEETFERITWEEFIAKEFPEIAQSAKCSESLESTGNNINHNANLKCSSEVIVEEVCDMIPEIGQEVFVEGMDEFVVANEIIVDNTEPDIGSELLLGLINSESNEVRNTLESILASIGETLAEVSASEVEEVVPGADDASNLDHITSNEKLLDDKNAEEPDNLTTTTLDVSASEVEDVVPEADDASNLDHMTTNEELLDDKNAEEPDNLTTTTLEVIASEAKEIVPEADALKLGHMTSSKAEHLDDQNTEEIYNLTTTSVTPLEVSASEVEEIVPEADDSLNLHHPTSSKEEHLDDKNTEATNNLTTTTVTAAEVHASEVEEIVPEAADDALNLDHTTSKEKHLDEKNTEDSNNLSTTSVTPSDVSASKFEEADDALNLDHKEGHLDDKNTAEPKNLTTNTVTPSLVVETSSGLNSDRSLQNAPTTNTASSPTSVVQEVSGDINRTLEKSTAAKGGMSICQSPKKSPEKFTNSMEVINTHQSSAKSPEKSTPTQEIAAIHLDLEKTPKKFALPRETNSSPQSPQKTSEKSTPATNFNNSPKRTLNLYTPTKAIPGIVAKETTEKRTVVSAKILGKVTFSKDNGEVILNSPTQPSKSAHSSQSTHEQVIDDEEDIESIIIIVEAESDEDDTTGNLVEDSNEIFVPNENDEEEIPDTIKIPVADENVDSLQVCEKIVSRGRRSISKDIVVRERESSSMATLKDGDLVITEGNAMKKGLKQPRKRKISVEQTVTTLEKNGAANIGNNETSQKEPRPSRIAVKKQGTGKVGVTTAQKKIKTPIKKTKKASKKAETISEKVETLPRKTRPAENGDKRPSSSDYDTTPDKSPTRKSISKVAKTQVRKKLTFSTIRNTRQNTVSEKGPEKNLPEVVKRKNKQKPSLQKLPVSDVSNSTKGDNAQSSVEESYEEDQEQDKEQINDDNFQTDYGQMDDLESETDDDQTGSKELLDQHNSDFGRGQRKRTTSEKYVLAKLEELTRAQLKWEAAVARKGKSDIGFMPESAKKNKQKDETNDTDDSKNEISPEKSLKSKIMPSSKKQKLMKVVGRIRRNGNTIGKITKPSIKKTGFPLKRVYPTKSSEVIKRKLRSTITEFPETSIKPNKSVRKPKIVNKLKPKAVSAVVKTEKSNKNGELNTNVKPNKSVRKLKMVDKLKPKTASAVVKTEKSNRKCTPNKSVHKLKMINKLKPKAVPTVVETERSKKNVKPNKSVHKPKMMNKLKPKAVPTVVETERSKKNVKSNIIVKPSKMLEPKEEEARMSKPNKSKLKLQTKTKLLKKPPKISKPFKAVKRLRSATSSSPLTSVKIKAKINTPVKGKGGGLKTKSTSSIKTDIKVEAKSKKIVIIKKPFSSKEKKSLNLEGNVKIPSATSKKMAKIPGSLERSEARKKKIKAKITVKKKSFTQDSVLVTPKTRTEPSRPKPVRRKKNNDKIIVNPKLQKRKLVEDANISPKKIRKQSLVNEVPSSVPSKSKSPNISISNRPNSKKLVRKINGAKSVGPKFISENISTQSGLKSSRKTVVGEKVLPKPSVRSKIATKTAKVSLKPKKLYAGSKKTENITSKSGAKAHVTSRSLVKAKAGSKPHVTSKSSNTKLSVAINSKPSTPQSATSKTLVKPATKTSKIVANRANKLLKKAKLSPKMDEEVDVNLLVTKTRLVNKSNKNIIKSNKKIVKTSGQSQKRLIVTNKKSGQKATRNVPKKVK